MKSIRWKLVFMYLSVVFIIMIITGTFIVTSTSNREKSAASEELSQCAVYVEDQVINQYDQRYFQDGLVNLTIVSSSLRNIACHILDNKGNTIASSTAANRDGFLQYKNSAIIAALNGHEDFVDNTKEVNQNSQITRLMGYAYPCLDKDGKVRYVIYVQMDAEAIYNTINQTTQTMFVAGVIALLFTALLGIYFSNTITTPIAILTKKANMMAKGRLEQRAAVKSNDEIGQLTKSFNTMARELKKTIVEMDDQRNKLEIVLHNMTDGVLAFDERGNLIHINKCCYDMLDIDDVNISLKWLLNKLDVTIDDIQPNTISEYTLNENDKYISVAIIPYAIKNKTNGIIVVLHDITKHRQLDNMRQEFVANVSHEIGTPLTTIKGYTELLMDGAIEDKDVANQFLSEINEATDRMKILRDDLLDLSRFDTKVNKLNKEMVDLVEIVKGCVRQNIVVAEHKKQAIYFDPPKKSMIIFADSGRINQVITNIISNSMKYSNEGAEINISLREKITSYYLEISDNGIGMPKEDLDRIFDRFYRVDKARSRAMGGNGLGLSIAKEIMDAHNGKINVFSEVGVGTTMILVFPKA